jgi:parallel beta-helix repeat protein
MFTRKKIYIMTIVFLASMSTATWGLVYWPADYPATYLQDRPEDECLARVNGVIGTTVIDPNFILGCAHAYGGNYVGKTVSIGTNDSEDYVVVDRRRGVLKGSCPVCGYHPDLAVCRVKKIKNPPLPGGYDVGNDPNNLLEGANLSKWVGLYSDDDEVGKEIVFGSYGPQRLAISSDPWDNANLPKEVGSGTMNWGRNVVTHIWPFAEDKCLLCIWFDPIGTGDYVKYEVHGGDMDSGSGCFMKDGIEWKLAAVMTSYVSFDRISTNINWIDDQIEAMGGVRSLADLADIYWVGSDQGSWAVASNWDTNSLPTSSDKVGIDNETTAVISSGQADANELFVGIDDGGDLSQNGGDLAIERYMYIGGRVDCNSSSYTISDGTVSAKGIILGIRANGKLDVNDADVEITLRNLQLEQYSELEAEPNSTIQLILENDYGRCKIDGSLDIDDNADANELSGLGNLTLVCGFVDSNEYDPNIVAQLEVAGAENRVVGPNDFNTINFLWDKLVVGHDVNDVNDSAGRICVELVDNSWNVDVNIIVSYEAFYANTLELKAGATFELDPNTGNPPFNLYYQNSGNAKQFFMGDVNLDGIVDYNDLGIWTAHANDTGSEWPDGDMNGDRVVDINDKTIIETAIEKAKAPWPPNGSTILSVDALPLRWDASVDANSHDVYFGDTFSDVNDASESSSEFQGNQPGTTFELDDLEDRRGDTYYWRIDEVDSNDVVISKGYVWNFTFDPPQLVQHITTGDYYDGIQDVIIEASNGDVIEVYAGTYEEIINFDGKAITLKSEDPNDWDVVAATIIYSADKTEGVYFESGEGSNSVLLGCTVDGRVKCDGSSPSIRKCITTSGIKCTGGSAATIENNKMSNSSGHGVYISSSAGLIRNNWIYECSITGIYFTSATAAVDVNNNTIVDNSYGGIYFHSGTAPNVTNCILWDNNDDLYGCTATYSCIKDGDSGTGNISSAPCFVDAADDDYHLTPDSPCINVGDPNGNYAGQVDIDDDQRVVDAIVDMGAHETGRVYNTDKKLWYYDIQPAIDDSDNGDTLVVYPGSYSTPGPGSNTIDFDGKAITISGSDPDDWDVVAATVITSAAIFLSGEDTDSKLIGCTIDNCIDCDGSGPTIKNCIITEGIDLSDGGSAVIEDNKITGGSTRGILIVAATAQIRNNWIYDSTDGIFLYNTTAAVEVINNTIVDNSSAGIKVVSGTVPNITNCILWDNNDDLYGCTATYSCIEDCNDANGVGNICGDGNDPMFDDPNNYDYHIIDVNSPCINAGDPNGTYSGQTDIDGGQRVYAGRVDMGGDEVIHLVYNVQQDKFYYNIQDAIDEADNNDVLVVYPGSYSTPGPGSNTIDFDKRR